MIKKTWLFGIILVIPILGFVVAEGIQIYFNSELHSTLRELYPQTDEASISQMTIDRLCENPIPELQEICSTNENLNLMSISALGAGTVGITLLLIIWFAGIISRSNRKLLLIIFKPGLYLTAIILIGLILVYAALAMGAIYYGESMLIRRIHIGIIAVIGFGALSGVLVVAKNTFSLLKKAQTFVIGINILRNDAPKLWKQVEDIANQLGALSPKHIVIGLDPIFFVTEADVVCLSGNLSGRTLYCSLPLSRILSLSEFSSVIGHELGHFKGLDTKFSKSFYPIYRGTTSAIFSLQAAGGDGSASIALLPAIAILSYFLECFSVAESRISRDRELSADKEGANITNPITMSTTLVKVHVFYGIWNTIQQAAGEALREGKAFINVSKTYAEIALNQANPDVLDGIAETQLSHPTDSHPPLCIRLEALGIMLKDIVNVSLDVNPSNPAINIIDEAEKKEEEISGAYQAILAKRLGIDLNELTESNT